MGRIKNVYLWAIQEEEKNTVGFICSSKLCVLKKKRKKGGGFGWAGEKK
jgi:hypothetical protein